LSPSLRKAVQMNLSDIGGPIVPKEHGAWAVLYGSFLAGVGVAGRAALPVVFLLVGITAATFANGSLTILARSPAGPAHVERRRQALTWSLLYGVVAAAALVPLVTAFRMTFLLPFGFAAVFFLMARVFLIGKREDRSLIGELVGTAGLTMVGTIAHVVGTGEVSPVGTVLWLLLFLFFASGVFYVRMRVHGMAMERKGAAAASNPARWPCLLYHALLIVVVPALILARVVPWPVLLAFAPAFWRAAVGLRREEVRLNIRRLGWSEVAVATTFVLLLIAAFRLTPILG
jgi:hypothetical protein